MAFDAFVLPQINFIKAADNKYVGFLFVFFKI